MLQKALGGRNQFVSPQLGAVGYETGDTFLLCTDGLVQGLYDTDLISLLGSAKWTHSSSSPAGSLVAESIARSGRDNTTALIIRVR
jgi:PPM family protein phosphatase